MGIRVNHGVASTGHVVSVLANVTSRQHGDRAQVVGILLVNDSLDVPLLLRILQRTLQAHTNPPHAALQQRADCLQNSGAIEAFDPDHIVFIYYPIQDRAGLMCSVEILLVSLAHNQTDLRAALLRQYIRSDSRRPAQKLNLIEKGWQVGEAELGSAVGEAVEQADGEIVRGGINLGANYASAIAEDAVG